MIYLKHTEDAQDVFIPKTGSGNPQSLSLRIKNTIDLDTIIDNVVDLKTSALYYRVGIALPASITDGEYEYTLVGDGAEVASGIMIVGEFSAPQEYVKTIQYEQY